MSASHPSQHPAPPFSLWVTDPGVTTGQSLVTDRVAAMLATAGFTRFVLLPGAGWRALGVWLLASAGLARMVLRGRLRTLYLVCSRSNAGFVRDLPAYLARRAGVRVVVHVHGSDIVDLLQRRGIGAVARWALRGCTLIVPSAHLVESLARLGVRDCLVCENFVAAAPTAPALAAKAPGTPFVVLWNSNVMASKGFFAVAEAVSLLHAEGLPVRMVALGAPLADETLSAADCTARLATYTSRPWMDYRGPVDRPGARQALQACDIVCLPSHYASECQPLALLEAMCMDKPLLVADTAALRATVQDYPCEIITQIDARTIAQALQRSLYSDRPLRAASLQAAGERARDRFSAERFDRQLHELLGIDNPPGPSTTTR
jgi:glycosyltransferase involved in cell wall biosynthesis